ncbi:hypothetical protein GF366_02405 [Candidatus Peregrinibacteria bacterium]|nr:hypothetical protein [Candidatus Peregrinibacteria bacterium]
MKIPENQQKNIKNKNIHEKFVQYGKTVKEWMRKCALLLPEIEKRRIWKKEGFSSIYEYSAKLAGMSRYQVNEALRVLRKTEDKPELRKIVEEKGVNSVKPVAAIATSENEKFWAEKVRKMSKNTLEVYVKEFKKQQELPGKSSGRDEFFREKEENKVIVNMLIPKHLADQLQKLKGKNEWKDLMQEFLELREEKLRRRYLKENRKREKEKKEKGIKENKKNKEIKEKKENKENKEIKEKKEEEVKEKGIKEINEIKEKIEIKGIKEKKEGDKRVDTIKKIEKKALKKEKNRTQNLFGAGSRAIPTNIKKYIVSTTSQTCAFPGCRKQYAHLHHVRRFALYRYHDPYQIVPLCKEHHMLTHLGLVENEDRLPRFWKIREDTDKYDYKRVIDERVADFRGG